MFGAWFLKEKVRIVDVFTTILALFGMVMFFNGKLEFGGITGNLVAVLSGISYAWFTLFMRKQKDGDTLPAIFLGNIITALIGVPFMIQSFPAVKFVPVIALMALFQYTIPYILYSKAIKDVKAIQAVFITMLEPVLNPVWVFLLIKESPGIWALIGGCTVILSILLEPTYNLLKSFKFKTDMKNEI